MAKKVRVLHIAEAPGGVERYLVALLTKLKQNYNDQLEHILVCSDSFDEGKFRNITARVEHVPEMHHAIDMGYDWKSIMAVRRLIRKYKPDVVYCHSSKAGAIGRMANIGMCNRYGKRNFCIYNAHGWAFNMKGAAKRTIHSYTMIEKMLAYVKGDTPPDIMVWQTPDGRDQMTFAYYAVNCLPAIEKQLAAGRYRLRGLLEEGIRFVRLLTTEEGLPEERFRNLNTLEDID